MISYLKHQITDKSKLPAGIENELLSALRNFALVVAKPGLTQVESETRTMSNGLGKKYWCRVKLSFCHAAG